MFRSVVIVGRPNVGKSRLFNRLTRSRISIVHDQPGVTRDVISAEVKDGGYILMDTGGLGLKDGEKSAAAIIAASEQQVDFAIDTAAVIVFVIDGLSHITALDDRIAKRLRSVKKPVIVAVNKADFGDEKADHEGIARLGLGPPIFVSAEHGRGEADLRRAILDRLGPADAAGAAPAPPHPEGKAASRPICISFIGRPNVGKSSLANRLLKSDRLIVNSLAGTTRDAIELPFEFRGRDKKLHPFRLIDTAGIKAVTKLASPVEYFARLRSLEAMQRSDVVFLVLDAVDGVGFQDKAIAGEAVKDRKPIIVIVNKWDLVHAAFKKDGAIGNVKSEREYREKYEKELFQRLFFTPGAPLIFVSAMTGYEVDRMLNSAVQLCRVLDKKLPTARLNETLQFLTQRTPPPAIGNRRFKVFYATQTGNRPFRIKLFCNREESLSESYRRYLEAGLVKEFELQGCPIEFELVGKPRGAEVDRSNWKG